MTADTSLSARTDGREGEKALMRRAAKLNWECICPLPMSLVCCPRDGLRSITERKNSLGTRPSQQH
eukprot:scaffold201416_cov33-Tisochrysis_lutea.AAC.1